LRGNSATEYERHLLNEVYTDGLFGHSIEKAGKKPLSLPAWAMTLLTLVRFRRVRLRATASIMRIEGGCVNIGSDAARAVGGAATGEFGLNPTRKLSRMLVRASKDTANLCSWVQAEEGGPWGERGRGRCVLGALVRGWTRGH